MRIAYLGPPGTFGEQAALRYRAQRAARAPQAGAGPAPDLLPFPSHAGVAAAVQSGMADEGLLAVENSVEGSVAESLDILIHDQQLHVRGELVIAIEQCLIVAPGRRADEVRVIFSHPTALGQCRGFLERCFPKAQLEPALSTAEAVREALERPDAAAIAAARAAELHGAEVLARGIQDRRNNVTRFVVVGRTDAEPTGDDKTSLAFTTYHDRPGTLVAVLQELAVREINLTRIESRPGRDQLGVYVFLVDFQGHRCDPHVEDALNALREKTQTLHIIGSYPRFVME
jgi:prephenate dehydratase